MREGMQMPDMGMAQEPEKKSKKKKAAKAESFSSMTEEQAAEAVTGLKEKEARKLLKKYGVTPEQMMEQLLEDLQAMVFEKAREQGFADSEPGESAVEAVSAEEPSSGDAAITRWEPKDAIELSSDIGEPVPFPAREVAAEPAEPATAEPASTEPDVIDTVGTVVPGSEKTKTAKKKEPAKTEAAKNDGPETAWEAANRTFGDLASMDDDELRAELRGMKKKELQDFLRASGVQPKTFMTSGVDELRKHIFANVSNLKRINNPEAAPKEEKTPRPHAAPPENLPVEGELMDEPAEVPEEGEQAPATAPPSSDLDAQSGVFEIDTGRFDEQTKAETPSYDSGTMDILSTSEQAAEAAPEREDAIEMPSEEPETQKSTAGDEDAPDTEVGMNFEVEGARDALNVAFKERRRQESLQRRLEAFGISGEAAEAIGGRAFVKLMRAEMDQSREKLAQAKAAMEKLNSDWRPRWLGGAASAKRAELSVELESAEKTYERQMAAYAGEKAYRFNMEATRLADATGDEMMKEKGFGMKFRELSDTLGAMNLEKAGWKPTGRIGKAIARGVNVRSAISAGLVAGGAAMGGGVLAFGMGALGRGIRGAAAAFGSYDLMKTFREREKDVTHEDVAGMDEKVLAQRVAELQARAALGGKSAGDNVNFVTMRRELSKRQRAFHDGVTETGNGLLDVYLAEKRRDSDVAVSREKAVRRMMKTGAAAIGVAAGTGVMGKAIGRGFGVMKDFFFGSGEVPTGSLEVAPEDPQIETSMTYLRAEPDAPETVQANALASETPPAAPAEVAPELSQEQAERMALAEIRSGDGYGKILSRQLSADPKRFGYDPAVDGDQKSWIIRKVGEIARKNGLVGDGTEMRLRFDARHPSFVLLNDDLSLKKSGVEQYSVRLTAAEPEPSALEAIKEDAAKRAESWPGIIELDDENPYVLSAEEAAETDLEAAIADAKATLAEADEVFEKAKKDLAMENARATLRAGERALAEAESEAEADTGEAPAEIEVGIAPGANAAQKVEAVADPAQAAEILNTAAAEGDAVKIDSFLGKGWVRFSHDDFGRPNGVSYEFGGRGMSPMNILKDEWPGIVMDKDPNMTDWEMDMKVQGDAMEIIAARRVLKSMIDAGISGKELDFMKDFVKAMENELEDNYGDILK